MARKPYSGKVSTGTFSKRVSSDNTIILSPQTGIVPGDTVYMYPLPGEQRIVGLWAFRDGLVEVSDGHVYLCEDIRHGIEDPLTIKAPLSEVKTRRVRRGKIITINSYLHLLLPPLEQREGEIAEVKRRMNTFPPYFHHLVKGGMELYREGKIVVLSNPRIVRVDGEVMGYATGVTELMNALDYAVLNARGEEVFDACAAMGIVI